MGKPFKPLSKKASRKLKAKLNSIKKKLKLDRKAKKKTKAILEAQLKECEIHVLPLRKELKKAKKKVKKDKKAISKIKFQLSPKKKPTIKKIVNKTTVDPKVTENTSAKVVQRRPDNLKRIEGIGVKIEQLLKADGIDTFEKLAEASFETLRGILDKAGPRFRMHKPDTWGEQSAIAAQGNWDALKKLQDELKGGIRK